jgi:hypothetical protein
MLYIWIILSLPALAAGTVAWRRRVIRLREIHGSGTGLDGRNFGGTGHIGGEPGGSSGASGVG